MIGVKTGTQTWSNSTQQSGLKPDKVQTLSATEKEQFFQGAEDIGDALNKVADPNYINTSKKMRAVGDNTLGKDSFMTLLLTQMKNQDPTNPLKSHEMAAQLAQFTSLEKLTNISDGIDSLRKEAKPEQNFQALALIGKSITTDNSKISRADANSQHEVRFNLAADAPNLSLQVKDSAGAVVRTLEFKNIKAGKNDLVWNGLNDDGQPAPIGEYTVDIVAMGSNGRKLHAETKTEGVITGVNFTPQGPVLMVGKQQVSLAEVKTISDASAAAMMAQSAPPAKMSPNEGLKKVEIKPETKPNAEKAAKIGAGNLNDAAMAQGLINKLNKEGAKAGMG